MSWLRSTWVGITTAALAFIAAFLAAQANSHKQRGRKWEETAVRQAEENVDESIDAAAVSFEKARAHNSRAKESKARSEKTLDAIARKDPELAAVLDRWRSDRMRDNDA